ncbi:hypothetical protein C5S53_17020 [Methanophagales archaeon]|nr:hypothetical protein C5S53_17020 [Methanophagales archaeon]
MSISLDFIESCENPGMCGPWCLFPLTIILFVAIVVILGFAERRIVDWYTIIQIKKRLEENEVQQFD